MDHSYQKAFAEKDGSSKEAIMHLFILVAQTSRRKIMQTSRKKIAVSKKNIKNIWKVL